MTSRTLVLADYPIGYSSGFGQTLHSLLDGMPDDQLWNSYPAHLLPEAAYARGAAVPFESPSRPKWLPAALHLPYYPVLKLRQWLARRALIAKLSALIERESIQALLCVPVSAWILGAVDTLARRHPRLKLVLFVMDDWQGHHETFGLPFTVLRRRLWKRLVERAQARFAVSREMAKLYEDTWGSAWDVAHHIWLERAGANDDLVSTPAASRPAVQSSSGWPRVLFLGGDVNAFRGDAVVALGKALERHQAKSPDRPAVLSIYGDISPDLRDSLASLSAVRVVGRRSRADCLAAMRDADLLYLPLSFSTPVRRIALYSLPTKLAEYLATGLPVLFHVPAASAANQIAVRHGLTPRLNSIDAAELDAFVDAWTQGKDEGGPWSGHQERAARALITEFNPDGMRERFQAAFQ